MVPGQRPWERLHPIGAVHLRAFSEDAASCDQPLAPACGSSFALDFALGLVDPIYIPYRSHARPSNTSVARHGFVVLRAAAQLDRVSRTSSELRSDRNGAPSGAGSAASDTGISEARTARHLDCWAMFLCFQAAPVTASNKRLHASPLRGSAFATGAEILEQKTVALGTCSAQLPLSSARREA
jgi:hypothetical protein